MKRCVVNRYFEVRADSWMNDVGMNMIAGTEEE